VAYSNYSEWGLDRWRWEFLRRRNDYRRDYVAAYQTQIASGFIQADENERFFNCDAAIKYELVFFYDPEISDWGEEGPSWYEPRIMLSSPIDQSHRWWQFKTLTFDLSKPIFPQLEAAKVILDEEQGLANLTPQEQMTLTYGPEYSGGRDIPMDKLEKELNHKPRAMKFEPSHWALYLRVLDAREAAATLSQIAEILPIRMGRRDAKAAHNVYEQARARQIRF